MNRSGWGGSRVQDLLTIMLSVSRIQFFVLQVISDTKFFSICVKWNKNQVSQSQRWNSCIKSGIISKCKKPVLKTKPNIMGVGNEKERAQYTPLWNNWNHITILTLTIINNNPSYPVRQKLYWNIMRPPITKCLDLKTRALRLSTSSISTNCLYST